MNDTIKTAAKYLRETLDLKVGSSHAHAAVSGYLGYKSKKALLADNYDCPIEDEHILLRRQGSQKSLSEAILKMHDSPLKKVEIHKLAEIIKTGLTPNCEQCGEKTLNSSPVYTKDCEDDPDGQVCESCSSFYDDEYATCVYCGSDVTYRADQINADGECSEHEGESYMDEEEKEGWESLIENWNKDS